MARTSQRTPEQEWARYNWISTSEAARRLGKDGEPCSNDHVLGLIADGELEARDTSRAGSRRPEWQVNPESVDAFLARRTNAYKYRDEAA